MDVTGSSKHGRMVGEDGSGIEAVTKQFDTILFFSETVTSLQHFRQFRPVNQVETLAQS